MEIITKSPQVEQVRTEETGEKTDLLFDSGVIRIGQTRGIPDSAVTIQPGMPKEGLQYAQKDLFSKFLDKD